MRVPASCRDDVSPIGNRSYFTSILLPIIRGTKMRRYGHKLRAEKQNKIIGLHRRT